MPSGREERIALEVTAEDNASRTLDKIAGDAEALERLDPEVAVGADDNASRVIADVAAEARELAARDHEVALTARVADLRAALSTAEADLDRVRGAAGAASDEVRTIGDASDQSRSVLANMVGNATQDLGELGGVAGTAGMAIGQLAEYATEGNIALGGLLKTAGPMVAIGAAVAFVTSKLAAAKREAEATAEAAESIVAALREGDLDAAARTVVEDFGDILAAAEDMGFGVEDATRVILGQADAVPELEAAIRDLEAAQALAGDRIDNNTGRLNAHRAEIDGALAAYRGLRDEIDGAAGALESEGTSAATAATQTDKVRAVMGETAERTEDTERATRDLAAAYDYLRGKIDVERSLLDVADAFDEVTRTGELAWEAAATGAEDAEDASRDHERAVLDLKGQILAYADSVGTIPTEVVTDMLADVDDGSYAEAQWKLAELEKDHHTNLIVTPTIRGWSGGATLTLTPGPRSAPAPASTTNVTVHMPRGTRAADVVRVAEQYARRNGGRAVLR